MYTVLRCVIFRKKANRTKEDYSLYMREQQAKGNVEDKCL